MKVGDQYYIRNSCSTDVVEIYKVGRKYAYGTYMTGRYQGCSCQITIATGKNEHGQSVITPDKYREEEETFALRKKWSNWLSRNYSLEVWSRIDQAIQGIEPGSPD